MRKWPDPHAGSTTASERIARLGVVGRGRLVEDRLERACRAARRSATSACSSCRSSCALSRQLVERERGGGAVERGVQLEQRLVDRPELLGAEVAEVDGAADAPDLDGRERADRAEQVVVGELRVGERADRLRDQRKLPSAGSASGGQPSLSSAAITSLSCS